VRTLLGDLQAWSGVTRCFSQSESKLPFCWSEAADDLGYGSRGPMSRFNLFHPRSPPSLLPAPRPGHQPAVGAAFVFLILPFCTLGPSGSVFFQRHGRNIGGGLKLAGQYTDHRLALLGWNTFLRTTTFWILFGLLFWHYLIWWIYPRVFSMKHVPGLVKPHELRF
jgi:hypothetical protein